MILAGRDRGERSMEGFRIRAVFCDVSAVVDATLCGLEWACHGA